MNISPWAAFIVMGSWFVLFFSILIAGTLAVLAELFLGRGRFRIPKRYFALVALALWMAVILSVVKRGYWRKEHGFDVGFMDGGGIVLAGSYYMFVCLDCDLNMGNIVDATTKEESLDRCKSLGSDGHHIWGILDDYGLDKYFFLDAQTKKILLFEIADKKKYDAVLRKAGIQSSVLLGPKEFYEKKLKEADEPDIFSLRLWFS